MFIFSLGADCSLHSNLIYLLQDYSNNNVQKAIKRPKIYFMDTGLACYLTGYINSEIWLLRKNEGTIKFTLIPTIELSVTRRKEYGWWIDIHFKFLIITLNTRIYLNQTWEKIQLYLNYKRVTSTREEGAQNTKLTWKQWLNLDVK